MNAENIVGFIGWIPVERDLPDADETVLIYAPDGEPPVWLGYYGDPLDSGVMGWTYVDALAALRVTHWAPMPEGPK